MPGQHVSDRPRLRWEKLLLPSLPGERVPAEQGVCSEFLVAAIRILDSFMFIVGSVCFFSWMGHRTEVIGDWLFICGSSVSCLLSGWAILELVAEHRYLKDSFDELAQDELLEAINYFLANVVFAIGSVFFMPDLFASAEDDNWAKRMGSWFFIVGSFGSVTAGYWNSLAMAAKSRELRDDDVAISSSSYIAKIELWFTMLGSVCFCVGSFLYQPSYGQCSTILPVEERLTTSGPAYVFSSKRSPQYVLQPLPEDANITIQPYQVRQVCLDVMDEGTWMYLIGSLAFLVQALLQLWRAGVAQASKEERRARRQPVRRYTVGAF